MGIPSFFGYIMKKHYKYVIHKSLPKTPYEYLCIDANSIIYDAYNKYILTLPADNDVATTADIIENKIILMVAESLKTLIAMIHPTMKTYIAFDGVCPLAKMKHQRIRRMKTFLLRQLPCHQEKIIWDTINITPGTDFMKKLMLHLKNEFIAESNVILSGVDEIGEGESKICHYIRNISHTTQDTRDTEATQEHAGTHDNKRHKKDGRNINVAFYGLDNDIIMLSLLHLEYCKNITVFREEKKKDLPPYIFIDIDALHNSILYEMNCKDSRPERVIDYVFMCFFLGNDFLPKFPSIQTRTHGITLLLDVYRMFIGNYNSRFLISNYIVPKTHEKKKYIHWRTVSLFIRQLAIHENKFFIIEDKIREKVEGRMSNTHHTDELYNSNNPDNIPIVYRQIEKYICPTKKHWEWRYYQALFHATPESTIQESAIQESASLYYLQGLEWTFKYYTGHCPDWEWMYPFNYPPLLQDLQKYVPFDEKKEFFPDEKYNPCSMKHQLIYVMPPSNMTAEEIQIYMKTKKFQWAYCRFLWEATIIENEQ